MCVTEPRVFGHFEEAEAPALPVREIHSIRAACPILHDHSPAGEHPLFDRPLSDDADIAMSLVGRDFGHERRQRVLRSFQHLHQAAVLVDEAACNVRRSVRSVGPLFQLAQFITRHWQDGLADINQTMEGRHDAGNIIRNSRRFCLLLESVRVRPRSFCGLTEPSQHHSD